MSSSLGGAEAPPAPMVEIMSLQESQADAFWCHDFLWKEEMMQKMLSSFFHGCLIVFCKRYIFNIMNGSNEKNTCPMYSITEKKSSAWSATLGDTSWARLMIKLWPSNTLENANLWLHLASWNLPDILLCLDSKTEPRITLVGGTLGYGA